MGPSEGDKRASTDQTLTVTIRRREEGPYGTVRIPYRGIGWAGLIAGLLILGCVLMIATWGHFVLPASKVANLEEEIGTLRENEKRIEALAPNLAEVETAHERIRSLFGAAELPAAMGGAS